MKCRICRELRDNADCKNGICEDCRNDKSELEENTHMKMIKLKSLHLENFKGIKDRRVLFTNKTQVSGANATGKTTIFDAFTWLLFNKNSAGEEKFQVRPLDAAGNRVDNVEIKVSATLDVDGKEVELSKVQKQNWVKHRRSSAPTLDGNVNSFEVDGYPRSEKEYKTYISELVAEDLFKMMTNPQYFVNMKWKDQRDILMKFVSSISDVELAQGRPEFADLLPELEKAPSTDDIAKKYNKALSEWKKKQAEIPVRIDELSKSIVDIDVAEQELARSDLERQIAEVDKKISNAGVAVSALQKEEIQLQFDMSGIMQTMNRELQFKRRELDNAKDESRNLFSDTYNKIVVAEKQIEGNTEKISSAEKKRTELGEQYKTELAKTFVETPYLFNEGLWVFDENNTVCSMCGQTLPADKIEQLRAEFEDRKAKAKADTEKQIADAKERFANRHNATLEEIKADGFKQKNIIEKLTAENSSLQEQIKVWKKQEQEALAKQNELTKQLSELQEEADYSQNEEYARLKARHDEVLAKIAKANFLGHDELLAQFEAEKADLREQLEAVKAEIAKAARNVEIEERIEELEKEKQEVGQKVADQEKMLYLLEQFIKAKMLKISESINSKFNTVSWKLFETQINGGMKECCECTVNGVPYSTLNSGHRIIAGLDIINSLSQLYGVEAPVFIDNAESVNEFNLPEMDTQLILLSVTDDKELKVGCI